MSLCLDSEKIIEITNQTELMILRFLMYVVGSQNQPQKEIIIEKLTNSKS